MTGLETWFVRGGSAAAMVYIFVQPGMTSPMAR
jgi:hypothetical protein